jgi:hypothetical protein
MDVTPTPGDDLTSPSRPTRSRVKVDRRSIRQFARGRKRHVPGLIDVFATKEATTLLRQVSCSSRRGYGFGSEKVMTPRWDACATHGDGVRAMV